VFAELMKKYEHGSALTLIYWINPVSGMAFTLFECHWCVSYIEQEKERMELEYRRSQGLVSY
jgi:hypothetical protein